MPSKLRSSCLMATAIALSVLCTGSTAPGAGKLAHLTLPDLEAELAARATSAAGAKSAPGAQKSAAPHWPALAGASSRELLEEVRVREKVIYGLDDRREAFDTPHAVPRRNLRSTAALLRPDKLEHRADGTWVLRAPSFREAVGVCADEPFSSQPVAGFCTGFLIGSDRLATAGHCIRSGPDLASVLVVFGFQMRDATAVASPIRDADVYRPVELLGRAQDDRGADWAVVRLDRAVAGREALPLRNAGKIPDSERVYVVGHPVGLPEKFGGEHAVVRDNASPTYFVANLNTYGGNSGSPVFDAARNEVVGILVRGEQDFVTVEGGCLLSKVCPTTGCRGEDVTRILQLPLALRAANSSVAADRLARLDRRDED